MIPFKGGNTISYGNSSLELSSATSIASPAAIIDGVPYIFMVSLDHRLRIWNLVAGKMVYIGDILNQELESHEEVKKVIDPSQSQLVKVLVIMMKALYASHSLRLELGNSNSGTLRQSKVEVLNY